MTRKEFKRFKKKQCPKHICMLCRHQEQCFTELEYDGATFDEMIVVLFIMVLTLLLSFAVCTGFYTLG